MSFADLKRNSRTSNIDKMLQVANQDKRKNFNDPRFWKPTLDKAKNGYAVIRFLPAPAGESLPWAKYIKYGFRGPTGQWYIENSLMTFGKPDPVAELNKRMWDTGSAENQAQVRTRSQRIQFVSNILVLKDSGNPSHEGKVYLYQYGKKIHDKIVSLMQPEFEDEERIDPFDFWNGCDFRLKVQHIGGFTNYDKSQFDAPSPLLGGDDEQLETLYNSLHKLAPFTDPNNTDLYKTYDQLSARLNLVMQGTGQPTTNYRKTEPTEYKVETVSAEYADPKPTPQVVPVNTDTITTVDPNVQSTNLFEVDAQSDEKEDTPPNSVEDTLRYFENLANDHTL